MRVFVGICLLGCLALGCSQPAPPPPTRTPTSTPIAPVTPTPAATATPEAPAVDTSSWIEFEAPDKSFTAKLPQKPDITQSEKEEDGISLTYYGSVIQVENDSFSLEWIDYPDAEAAKKAHEDKLKDLRAEPGGKIKAEVPVELDSKPGIRFEMADQGNTFYNSVFLVENRIYDFLVTHQGNKEAHDAHARAMAEAFKFSE